MSSTPCVPVTIVLPVYQPKDEWKKEFLQNLNEWKDFLAPLATLSYVVVHDGFPSDEVLMEFKSISAQFPEVKFTSYCGNRGKGYALREGVRLASTNYVFTMDFDFPYQKESAVTMISLLQNGNDVIVGKRSNEYFHQIPFKRKAISKIFSWLAQSFLGLQLRDTQSGIKSFNVKGQKVFLETTINRFLVDTEFVLRASKKNLQVKTIQIQPRAGLSFTNFGLKVIRTESANFFRLLKLNLSLAKSHA